MRKLGMMGGLAATMMIVPPAVAQRSNLIAAEPVVTTPSGMQAWKIRYLAETTAGSSAN